jgi:hypothetical protein
MGRHRFSIEPRATDCTKRKYQSLTEAIDAALQLQSKDRRRGLEPVRLWHYRCPRCHAWHLSRSPARR